MNYEKVKEKFNIFRFLKGIFFAMVLGVCLYLVLGELLQKIRAVK